VDQPPSTRLESV